MNMFIDIFRLKTSQTINSKKNFYFFILGKKVLFGKVVLKLQISLNC